MRHLRRATSGPGDPPVPAENDPEPISSKRGIQEFYDDPAVVDSYIAVRISEPFNTVLHERQVGFLNQVIGELQPRRMLEIAVGPGRLSAEVGAASVMVGMDGSPNMLAEARRRTRARGRAWNFVRGDGFRLPFASGSIDLIYTIRFLRHFDRAGRDAIYRELTRVLRPGGHLVLDAQNRLVSLPHRLKQGLHTYKVYDELWLRDELVAELEGAGLVPRRVEGVMRRFTWQRRLNRLRYFRLGSPARLLIRALEWSPDRNPSTWMVLCQAAG